jgi:uncharacterized protein
MKVRIDEIPSEGLTVDLIEDGNRLFEKGAGLRFEEKVVSHLVLRRVGQNAIISGDLRTELSLQCGRCLEEYKFSLDADVSLEYRPASEIGAGGDVQLAAEEMDIQYYSGDAINLDEVIMGQVGEGTPFKPLCRKDCLGLCSHCGKNLNGGECGCARESIDPRFAKLKDLLKEQDRK